MKKYFRGLSLWGKILFLSLLVLIFINILIVIAELIWYNIGLDLYSQDRIWSIIVTLLVFYIMYKLMYKLKSFPKEDKQLFWLLFILLVLITWIKFIKITSLEAMSCINSGWIYNIDQNTCHYTIEEAYNN